jgi:hypothetical protein
MKIKLLTTALAKVMSSTAIAQSAFQSFYGQFGVRYENVSLALTVISWRNFVLNGLMS